MPRKKSSLGRLTLSARRIRLKRQKETAEEKNDRIYLTKLLRYYRNQKKPPDVQEEKRVTRLRKGNYELRSIRTQPDSKQKSKKPSENKVQRRQMTPDACRKLRTLRSLDRFYAIESRSEPKVKMEPNSEMEEIEVHETLELCDEIKQEYICESLLVEIVPTKYEDTALAVETAPIIQENGLRSNTPAPTDNLLVEIDAPETAPITDLAPVETADGLKKPEISFSQRKPLRTKVQALKCVNLLEGFALLKEDYRLIGFTERLQQLINKGL